MIELDVAHTHLYPGARIRISSAEPHEGHACQLTFSDRSMAMGQRHITSDDVWELDVSPYETAADAAIPAKSWRLSADGDDGLKVVAPIDRNLVP